MREKFSMMLLTKQDLKNLKNNLNTPELERKPVVKFFGGSSCTWLISEIDANNVMFGLCDLGQGFPELGYVSLDELAAVKFPPFGLPVERDRWFEADKTVSEYASEASERGYIQT
jgi:hypothetical protein